MLNISAISYHTTTGRSNSFDISDLNSSPRSKLLLKHAMKSSSISTYDTKQHTTSTFPPKDLQNKVAFLTAEVDRLTVVNSELLAEIGDWKKHFREAEKLIGKNATITITKNVIDEQVNQRCRELEALVADLTARLKSATLLESNQKRHGAEMTPKAKGDLTFRTPRFAKGDIRPLWESSPNYEGKRNELLNLKAVSLQQQLCNIEEKIPSENIEELSEMAEPIYMKALVFEDSIEKCEKRIDLSIVEAIKGDDALSLDQSFSESLNRLNRSLDNAETFIEGIPKTCASSRDQKGECCENRGIELEKLREEVRKLRRDVNGYEGVAIVLSKKAQEAIKMKKEKEILEQELNTYKQKLAESEKNQINGQNSGIKAKGLDESQRKMLEITDKQIGLLKEKECLILELNKMRNELKSGLQREEKLKLELCSLTQVLEESTETLKACDQQKSKFQGRIVELDKVVEKLNREIGVWKEEYEKLENRTKQHQQADSEQKEQKIGELLTENSSLNEMITAKLNEIEELRRSHKRVMEAHKEEMSQKWLKSCLQMEEIALSLESRKNNMQAQLERMQAISGENAQELEELHVQNELIKQENKGLLEEVSQLRAKEEQYKQLLNGLKDRL